MKNVYLYPYKAGSNSAKELANALGIKRIKTNNSTFKGGENKIVINWGSSELPEVIKTSIIINNVDAVALAANKLKYFQWLEGSGVTPKYTTRVQHAVAMIEEGYKVVERHTLTGHGGAGVRIVSKVEDLQDVPLYVQYIPKKSEFRVHVFNGVVLDVQRKVRDRGIPDEKVNWQVRNHDNGFVFARKEALGDVPDVVKDVACLATKRLGLLFGAVDVIYNEGKERAYALEVNTAPGLAGETVEIYAKAFKDYLGFVG